MQQFLKLSKMFGKFLLDKKYRNIVLSTIQYHSKISNAVKSESDNNNVEELNGKKVFLIGGCELTFIKELLEASCVQVIHTFDVGGSSMPLSEVVNDASPLWEYKPDIVILSNVQTFRGIIQKNQLTTFDYTEQEQENDVRMTVDEYRQSTRKIFQKLSPKIWVLSYPLTYRPTYGWHEYKSFPVNKSQIELIRWYELALYDLCKSETNTYLLDVNLILENSGKNEAIRDHDADGIYEHFTKAGAYEIVQNLGYQLRLLNKTLQRVKCAVFDLDNTLWEGVLREDGVSGIKVRENYLNIMQILARRGILLALCSKNDPQEVVDIKAILGETLFNLITIVKINWQPKSISIKEISSQLNIGLDSVAFFDDNPFERTEVETNAPEVMVFDEMEVLNSLYMPEFIPYGQFSQVSADRVQKYKEQSLRDEARQQITESDHSYQEFLESSELAIELRRPEKGELSRVLELLQRTNQLNATLKRTEQDDLMLYYDNDQDYGIYCVFLNDKFGDYGMVGVCIIHHLSTSWDLLEIAFSCRAMGRKVEHALIAKVFYDAYNSKIESVTLTVTRNDRNQQMIRILEELGFQVNKQHSEKGSASMIAMLERPPMPISHYASWLKVNSQNKDHLLREKACL